jgi:hypothetical protein
MTGRRNEPRETRVKVLMWVMGHSKGGDHRHLQLIYSK